VALLAAPLGAAERRRRPQASPGEASYGTRPDVVAFADGVADRLGIEPRWVRRALARARRIPAVQQLIMPPAAGTPKNWLAYRDRFVEPQRVAAGLVFWRQHESWLQQAQERWGVPPEIVVAIVGVETYYGRVMGNFRVLDALSTLSFDFPPGRSDRSAFFRYELEQFLLWCRREGRDPLEPRGSYAGAIGLPQFMPSSMLRFGLDYDGDGHIDLHRNGADVVGSVAHYLAQFGWQRGLPTHYAVEPPSVPEDLALLLAPDIRPSFTAAEMTLRGARLEPAAQGHEGLLALVELENGAGPLSYFAGSTNFFAITRYNWSSYYAMAVIHLGEALKAGR
jgi:membrane-bound lytic murein transglycosylase B